MGDPAVTVIIPTFNCADLLPRAIDSVIGQTFRDWEIVLVDDGSTDDTAGVASRYADGLGERFVHIRQSNAGSSNARNRGIDAARGRYVAFLDSDDEFRPTKLARQLELFEWRPELGLVYSDYSFVDLDGKFHLSTFDEVHPVAREVEAETVAPGLLACCGDLFGLLLRAYFISTIAGMVRRSVLGNSIRFSDRHSFGEEWLFYLQVVRRCRAGFVDEPLAVYHYQQGSLARTDKDENARRYLHLLRTMNSSLGQLDPAHRAALKSNLGLLCRQLGHVAHRRRRYGEAAIHFAQSVWHKPGVGTLAEMLECAALTPWSAIAGLIAGERGPQDASSVVR